jgi:hypothetical protein
MRRRPASASSSASTAGWRRSETSSWPFAVVASEPRPVERLAALGVPAQPARLVLGDHADVGERGLRPDPGAALERNHERLLHRILGVLAAASASAGEGE